MYDALREKALHNFDLLLNFWGVEYHKVNEREYDFLSPTRSDDKNYGACRFNIEKGRGADFAGAQFSDVDYRKLGIGFTKDDFHGYNDTVTTNWGFDIIGLAQRFYKFSSYKDAATKLKNDLQELSKKNTLIIPSKEASEQRAHRLAEQRLKLVNSANKIWKYCNRLKVNGTIGNRYLLNRGLYSAHKEESIRFHPKIKNIDEGRAMPALIFKVQIAQGYPCIAIHRIFLSDDGNTKANIPNPKKALASIKGAAIWFGVQSPILHIAEGPENALTLRERNCVFVASTISGANFPSLKIPDSVHTVVLCPDPDPAGDSSLQKAIREYSLQGKNIKTIELPKEKNSKGKYLDANDLYMRGLGDGRRQHNTV